MDDVTLAIHVYCPTSTFIVDSFTAGPKPRTQTTDAFGNTDGDDAQAEDGDEDQGEDKDVMAATVGQLPAVALEGIWDNLVYEDDVKLRLLNYIASTQLFGDRQVDFNVITWNRCGRTFLTFPCPNVLADSINAPASSFCTARPGPARPRCAAHWRRSSPFACPIGEHDPDSSHTPVVSNP